MTVSTTASVKQYTGNTSTTIFSFPYKVFNSTDFIVTILNSSTLVVTTQVNGGSGTYDYSVAVAADKNSANITFNNAPLSTHKITIERKMSLIQSTDYTPNDPFPAETHEQALDERTLMVQQVQNSYELNTFRFDKNVTDAGVVAVNKTVAERADKFLAFDASGDLTATQEIGTHRGNWAASTAYAVRDIVKDSSNSNVYICIVAHTSSGSTPISGNTDVAKWTLIIDAAAVATSATAAAASASTATAQAVIATAKAVLTASDATDTAADLVETAADVILTAADVVSAEAAKVLAEAATGASAFKFTFDNSTSMADPGTGELRLNHGTVGSVTAIAFDAVSADTSNPDVSDYIASWDDGTNSTHEGYITIRKSGTPATYAVFSLTGSVTDSTGWLQAVVTHIDSNGSWTNGDTMYISFARSGDKGATGSTGAIGPSAGLDMEYDDTTADADQGAGKISFNHATLSSASILYMDDVDSNAASINAFVDSWDDSTTSALRGTVTVTKQSDAAIFAIYNVTGAVTSASTYSKIPVSYITGAGSLSNEDAVQVSFTRTGNTGSAGSSTPQDDVFRIQDNGDNTKQIAFEASGISSGTTRTITVPDTAVTLVSSGAIANADINASAAIVTSKLSGAVTSIASHGLGALASLATVGNSQIDNNAVDEDKLKDALIGDFSDVTVTASDTFLYGDATDSGNTKKDTVQGILDLVSAGPTISANDPAIDTNATLGTQWANSTSGEFYVCTDATTDNNVWTNVDAAGDSIEPYSFGGSNDGYTHCGAHAPYMNHVDKFSFASATNDARDHGDDTNNRAYVGGNKSATHGYVSGGQSGSNVVSKIQYSSDTTYNASTSGMGTLSWSDRFNTGCVSSPTHGYTGGFESHTTSIEKITFATDAVDARATGLFTAGAYSSGQTSADYGYNCGHGGGIDMIQRYALAAETVSTDVGNLTNSGAGYLRSGQSSGDYGYSSGASSPVSDIIERFSFASGSEDAANVGDMLVAKGWLCGQSSKTYGYVSGGLYSSQQDVIERFSFATDTEDAADVGNLTVARMGCTGTEN